MKVPCLCGFSNVRAPARRAGRLPCARINAGFTLVELAIVITILAIAMAIAAGNVNTGRSQVLNDARKFKSSLAYARSESLNRTRNVVVCASATAMDDASLECAGAWQEGWLVFVDEDSDGSPSGGEVLRRHAALSNNVSVTASSGVTSIEFSFRGFSDSAVEFSFCSAAVPTAGRTISLASSGRVMKQPGTVDCS